MSRLTKFWSLSKREKGIVCEAGILLSLSHVCLKLIAFKHIDSFLHIRWFEGARGVIDREHEIRLVQHSITRAANGLPWNSLCLTRSIAEFIMLRRRGVPAIIFAGARFSGRSSLYAHAWVNTGLEVKDNNCFENSGFATVLRIGSQAIDEKSGR